MKTRLVFLLSFSFIAPLLYGQNNLPKFSAGTLERLEPIASKYVTSRNVDVWLPNGYHESKKYAVLYMHDGQMLYDPETTWNKTAWDVDDVAQKLIDSNQVQDFIIVGIWNGGSTRHADYFPQKPFETLSKNEINTVFEQLKKAGREVDSTWRPKSDDYLKYLIEELKPVIDQKYSVYKDQKNTFIAGSSMGGLISIYAICEYPEVFYGAACLSTHWVGTFTLENNPIPFKFIDYLKSNLPNPSNHKIYFDTGDQTLDALYPEIQKKVDQVMVDKGYDDSNFLTEFFPGENHSEVAWNKRLHIPLEFLLKQ
ncbi:MAG: alpha/beta hydrolase-fold protein [Nonlabens sp.]